MKKLLTSKEMADILRIKINTLYVWTSKKKIPYQKMGHGIMFDEEEIERWLRTKTIKPKPKNP